MEIVNEMWSIVMRVFGGADSISLIIMLLVVVAGGMALGQFSRIVQVTVGSLVIFGLIRLAYSIAVGATAPAAAPMAAWGDLKVMSVGDLVVYFLAFAIVITIVHAIRGAVQRGH